MLASLSPAVWRGAWEAASSFSQPSPLPPFPGSKTHRPPWKGFLQARGRGLPLPSEPQALTPFQQMVQLYIHSQNACPSLPCGPPTPGDGECGETFLSPRPQGLKQREARLTMDAPARPATSHTPCREGEARGETSTDDSAGAAFTQGG